MIGHFGMILGLLAAAAGLIAVLHRWIGVPLLILFAIPIAVFDRAMVLLNAPAGAA
jgi:hypothetical protein